MFIERRRSDIFGSGKLFTKPGLKSRTFHVRRTSSVWLLCHVNTGLARPWLNRVSPRGVTPLGATHSLLRGLMGDVAVIVVAVNCYDTRVSKVKINFKLY